MGAAVNIVIPGCGKLVLQGPMVHMKKVFNAGVQLYQRMSTLTVKVIFASFRKNWVHRSVLQGANFPTCVPWVLNPHGPHILG